MANLIEKRLPKAIRDKMTTMIITALGLFLALQYNETIKEIFETFFPLNSDTLSGRLMYIVILTILIVFFTVLVEQGLDGK
jgi:hypothetical protein